ncbi:MAG: Ig-like domain-containing protein, partial [Oscillibacter sp.]
GRGGKRATRRSQPSMLSPVLVLVIVLLAALLIYLLFGDKIAEKFRGDEPVTPPTQQTDPAEPTPPDVGGTTLPGDTDMPETPDSPQNVPDDTKFAKLPETLKVNNPDFTLSAGESFTVKVTSGGSGPYTWSSSDDGIASVDAEGKVTAISKGKVSITVYNATDKGTVTVYVKGGTEVKPTDPAAPPAAGPGKLNTEDFTQPVGSPDVQLTVSGTTAAITWDADNPKVATVTDKGVVHAVGKGTTTVTASYGGTVLKCIVRVPH